jgi:hypothetical protein
MAFFQDMRASGLGDPLLHLSDRSAALGQELDRGGPVVFAPVASGKLKWKCRSVNRALGVPRTRRRVDGVD